MYLNYRSAEIGSIASSENGAPAKKRRIRKNWVLDQTFSNAAEANEWLDREKQWGYHYENDSNAGRRVNYRCNLVLYRGSQCEAAIYLLYEAKNETLHVYRSDNEYTHANSISAVKKMTDEVQSAIRNMYEIDFNVKPLAILNNLARNNLTLPSKSQLQSFL